MSEGFEIYIDGACRGNPGPAAIGILIKDKQGNPLVRRGEFLGQSTNNIAEYTALLRSLKYLYQNQGKTCENIPLIVNTDSELLINQLNGNYRIRNKNLMSLVIKTRRLLKRFQSVKFNLIKGKNNKIVDKLANKALNLMEDIDDLNNPIAL